MGYAIEIEDPGDFEFLKGEKTFLHWDYIISGKEESQEATVIKEFLTDKAEEKEKKFYRFHFLFDDYQMMFFCDGKDETD